MLLSEVMPRFYNLTSLDLSFNYHPMDTATCRLLSETLASLPSLTRLDLTNNGTEHKLRNLLKDIQRPLEYLRICSGNMTESDLDYLAASHHATALQHLDISENSFGRKIGTVLVLLKAVAPTLHVLEMEDCDLEPTDMDALLAFCPLLTCVRFWNVAYNDRLRSARVIEHAENIVQMPQLQALQLSAPMDSFGSPQDEHMVIDNVQFSHRFTMHMSMLCERAGRPNIVVYSPVCQ